MDRFIQNIQKCADADGILGVDDSLHQMISKCEQRYDDELFEDDLEIVVGGQGSSYSRIKQRVFDAIKSGRTSII